MAEVIFYYALGIAVVTAYVEASPDLFRGSWQALLRKRKLDHIPGIALFFVVTAWPLLLAVSLRALLRAFRRQRD